MRKIIVTISKQYSKATLINSIQVTFSYKRSIFGLSEERLTISTSSPSMPVTWEGKCEGKI